MENQFLIPANSKRSMLYFGIFNKFDAILFGSGILVSLLAIMIVNGASAPLMMLAIMPGLVTGFLVLPIPNYHNILTIILSVVRFFTTRQKFIWKGWCLIHEQNRKK